MATITAKDVAALRSKTGLGMMECKDALKETGGDVEKAVDLLRQRGLAKMETRTERSAAEGRIAVAVSQNPPKAAIVEVNTETDFTAGNEAFVRMSQALADKALSQSAGEISKTDEMQALIDEVRLVTKENVQFARGHLIGGDADSKVGSYLHFTGKVGVIIELTGSGDVSDELLKDLCMHISAVSPVPQGVTEDEVSEETIAREREIAKAQAMESGKPENIAEKMVEGKIRKFLDEVVLLRQPFIKDDKKQIKDLLPSGVTIKQFVRYQVGG